MSPLDELRAWTGLDRDIQQNWAEDIKSVGLSEVEHMRYQQLEFFFLHNIFKIPGFSLGLITG